MKYYIARKAKSYVSCIEDLIKDEEKFKVIDASAGKTEKRISFVKYRQKQRTEKCRKLGLNRYTVPQTIGAKQKGLERSFWPRTENKTKNTKLISAARFYERPRDSEKLKKHCHNFKGKFIIDPRKRRPVTRFMVSNTVTCWRNPKDPGPTRYYIGIFNRQKFEKFKAKIVLPYKFIRYSCVPENKNSAHASKTSFDPGPGRYKLFDDEGDFLFELKTAYQKRLRFRRLPYTHIADKHNHSPLWRHIFGFGFTRLFRGPSLQPTVVSKKKALKVNHDIYMFPSFKYIKMITCPDRALLSIREKPIKAELRPMHYNCVIKFIIRRQLRNNKKIAFNSGTPRFPDSHMPTIKKGVRPPLLVDHPVVRVPTSEIQPRLHEVPLRLQGTFKENRIRPFKFQQFPPKKLLLDDNEIRPQSSGSIKMFATELSTTDFF